MSRYQSEVSSIKLKSNLLWKQKSHDTKMRWRKNYTMCKCGEKNSLWYCSDLRAHYASVMKSANYYAIKILEYK